MYVMRRLRLVSHARAILNSPLYAQARSYTLIPAFCFAIKALHTP